MEIICDVLGAFLSTYCELIHEYELTALFEVTADDLPLTVFVPDNNAFKTLEGNEVFGFDPKKIEFDSLTKDEAIFVLLYHVVNTEAQSYSDSDLECGQLTRTANGEKSRTRCNGTLKYQRGPNNTEETLPRISLTNTNVCNGVVHMTNNVILPNLNKLN